MYSNKVAVALKHNGKVLREFGENVYVPYGTEYTILVKNLNSVRALVTISIDGTDVGDGTKFVIGPNESIELERFIKNGNLDQGNRFKFIERTGKIEEHKGVGIEDGIVRVEYQFEKPQPEITISKYTVHYWYGNNPSDVIYGPVYGTLPSTRVSEKTYSVNNVSVQCETGITVPSSISEQKFNQVSLFPTESEKHVIVLHLLGETENNRQVVKPVTVKAKPKCSTCGKVNKATAKFCSECGTALEIV